MRPRESKYIDRNRIYTMEQVSCMFTVAQRRRNEFLIQMFNLQFFLGIRPNDKHLYQIAKRTCKEMRLPEELAEEFKPKTQEQIDFEAKRARIKLACLADGSIIYIDNETMIGYASNQGPYATGEYGSYYYGLKIPLTEMPYAGFERWARGMDV